MLSTRDPLTQALAVPVNLRTRRNYRLKNFHSFSQYPHTVEQIAMHLELQSFGQGEFVFQEGEQGDRVGWRNQHYEKETSSFFG
jgi:CRP-like cAMP-binding protein